MKRIAAHTVTAGISLVYLFLMLAKMPSVIFILWYTPNIIAIGTVVVLMLRNLKNKPAQVKDTPAVFCAAVISTNFCVIISLFGGLFPLYQVAPVAGLQMAGALINLLSMPFYISAVLSLGRGFTVLPEALTLQINGMYKISRHPIYLVYVFWCVSQNLIYQTASVLVFSALQIALFCYRARCEEKILLDTFPAYAAYAERISWLGPKKRIQS